MTDMCIGNFTEFDSPETSRDANYEEAANFAIQLLELSIYFTNPVVVFDIDNTLIYNEGGAILHMRRLYRHIMGLNIPIILITARPPRGYKETVRQLKHHGITGYVQLLMCDWKQVEDIPLMKCAHRENLCEDYTIVLNIGDQTSDFVGGYYVYGIKLPTYY